MKVKGKDESGPFKDDGLVILVMAGHVPGVAGQPTVLLLATEIKVT